jgi:ferredoxin
MGLEKRVPHHSSIPIFQFPRKIGRITEFTHMKINIKKEACIGCEICVNTCPEVFMAWGLYMRPVFEVGEPERYKDLIRKIIEECPARAISVATGELKADGTRG